MPASARRAALAAAVTALVIAEVSAARAAPDAGAIAHGKYLTVMGDCEACHTAPGGQAFAGGLEMNTPFGKISTPNITPDKTTGIGAYTDAQFIRVFHAGIGRTGQYLYPVMPFPWYAKVTDDDVLAIKAYLFSLAPINAPRKPLQISFPFNIRAGLAVWDQVFLTEGVFKPNPAQSADINRGAYIVQGLGHCGECHDSRNMLGAGAVAKPLQGGEIDHWYAPNITADVQTGVGRFSEAQLFTYLKTGSAPGMGTVLGPMAQTQHDSLAKLTDADLHAVAAYLQATPAKPGYQPTHLATLANGTLPGAQAYLNHCASCHQLNGSGIPQVIPSLVGNGAVKSGGPETVLRVVLGGVEAQGSYGPMPAVGVGMTDQEVADATNYVRAAWSNNASATTGPGEVAAIRKLVQTYLSFTLPGGCPTIANPALSKSVEAPAVTSLLEATNEGNIVQNVTRLIGMVKTAHAPQADVVNGLSIAYCRVLQKDTATPVQQRAALQGQFSERVYTQLTQSAVVQ